MSSGIISATGSLATKNKTLNLAGTKTNPVTGKDMSIRQEMIVVDDDSIHLLCTARAGWQEAKFMEGYFKENNIKAPFGLLVMTALRSLFILPRKGKGRRGEIQRSTWCKESAGRR